MGRRREGEWKYVSMHKSKIVECKLTRCAHYLVSVCVYVCLSNEKRGHIQSSKLNGWDIRTMNYAIQNFDWHQQQAACVRESADIFEEPSSKQQLSATAPPRSSKKKERNRAFLRMNSILFRMHLCEITLSAESCIWKCITWSRVYLTPFLLAAFPFAHIIDGARSMHLVTTSILRLSVMCKIHWRAVDFRKYTLWTVLHSISV